MRLKRKKEMEEYTVREIKEVSIVLERESEQIEVQKYKLPLELEVGDTLIKNELGMYEKK